MKFIYEILINPLGLYIEPLWEYIILFIVGELVHEIAWNISPGGTIGSAIYWTTKLLFFIIIWVMLYVIIAIVQWIITNWIIILSILGGLVLFLTLGFIIYKVDSK